MPEEWFVRVAGKEYGPVNLATLREWRAEGRLIPTNELRHTSHSEWQPASDVTDLFATPPPLQLSTLPRADRSDALFRRRTMGQIIGDSFGVYRRGFVQFFGLALLVAVPSCAMSISLKFVHTPENGVIPPDSVVPAAIALIMIVLVAVAWPIFVAGLQFATADLIAGRPLHFADLLRRASNIWPRMAKLSLLVYGSYVFWTALPLLVIASIAASGPSVFSILLALFALAVQVYMVGRLFINFLFWQQSASIGGLDGTSALRDSKELARSGVGAPAMQRPLYRGAVLASIWLLVLIAFSVAIELPFMVIRLRGVTTVEEVTALMQNLMNAPVPDALTIATIVLSSLVHAALRPLLGIVFVLLYCDAKARQ